MTARVVRQQKMGVWTVLQILLGAISSLLLIAGCGAGGDGSVSQAPHAQLEHQAILGLVKAYATALEREDIDRLQELLEPQGTPPRARSGQGDEASFTAPQAFRQAITSTFRTVSSGGVRVPASVDALDIAANPLRVTFQEEEHIEDPVALAQQSRLYRTTFQLAREENDNGVEFRIAGVRREGPRVQVSIRGQVVAGVPARVEVAGTDASFVLAGGDIKVPGVGDRRDLQATGRRLHAVFVPATDVEVQSLQLRLRSSSGEVVEMSHSYRVRVPGEGVVQRIQGTVDREVRAVALAADGTVWAAGDLDLYRVAPGESAIASADRLPLEDIHSRVEDLALDRNNRLHIVVFEPLRSGVILHSQSTFCHTVNAFDRTGRPDPAYPFLIWDPESETMKPSASTRAIAAGGGDIWLFGSDGGVARVADDVGQAPCPASQEAIAVNYGPVFRRQDGQEGNRLLTNTVPALVESADGALWFGTALGLMRWHDGQSTAVPFERPLTLSQDQIATLERFIQEVALAIREARPVEAVEIGNVSFLDFFGRALVKADFILSAVEDEQGRLWVGTLGGGIRRIEAATTGETFQDTLHLTRSEVARIEPGNRDRTLAMSRGFLVSNIIFALAMGSDGVVWAATDEGVSRIEEQDDGTFTITNFTALDGLRLPVRDIAVDDNGVAWAATDGGLFRIMPQGFQVSGSVRQAATATDLPANEVDVSVRDTPFQTVTNAEGQYVLTNLPPEHHSLQVEGDLANGGPFTEAFRPVELTHMNQTLAPIVLTQRQPAVPIDPSRGGRITFPTVPGAELVIQPGGIAFPDGVPPEIGLTLLPLMSPPYPLPSNSPIAVAAAELRPDGLSFTKPFAITLPNQGQLPTGRRVFLQCFKKDPLAYSLEGSGLVASDEMPLTVESFETPAGSCAAIVLAARASAVSEAPIHSLAEDADPLDVTLAVHRSQGKAKGSQESPRGDAADMVLDRLPVQHTTQQTTGAPQGLTLLHVPPEAIVDTVHALTFQLTDAAGLHVAAAGIPVSWIVGSPSSDPNRQRQAASLCLVTTETADCLEGGVTDAAGQVPVRLTVGHTAGPIRVVPFAGGDGGSAGEPINVQALPDRSKARLVIVSGNNQTGNPGQELAEPLVVQLEDQFDNPLPLVEVLATVIAGDAAFIDPDMPTAAAALWPQQVTPAQAGAMRTAPTNEQGEVRFALRVLEDAAVEERDIQVRVTVPALEQVRPVQFLAIVGEVDTPDEPLDLAVSRDIVYITDRFSGLQIIDVSNPGNPQLLHTLDLEGTEVRLSLVDDRVYMATAFPARIYILDITNVKAPDFLIDTDSNGFPDALLGIVDLPDIVQDHVIAGIEVQNGYAYVVTDPRAADSGTLQVILISDPGSAQVVGTFAPLASRPIDIAVSGTFAYVPAGASGLLTFDISSPSRPTLVHILGDPDPSDALEIGLLSGMTLAGGFAYLVQTQCEPPCNIVTIQNFFTVIDLGNPAAPQWRGKVQTRVEGQASSVSSAMEVTGHIAYLVQGPLGLQAIDISNPDVPQLIGAIDTPSLALNVTTAGQFIYVTDELFGLQVVRGPDQNAQDSDGDGVIDFFDTFPANPTESQDTDGDGIGDNADPDDDNDGFTDEEEQQASPPANPKDPRIFPLSLPPVGTTTIVVDASAPPKGNGTAETPYASLTAALRALQSGTIPDVEEVYVRAGIYSPHTSQEIFPLDLRSLSLLTLQGDGWETTVIDAGFTGDVMVLRPDTQIIIDGFTLSHGADGLIANDIATITLRRNRIVENIFAGVQIGINSNANNIITDNIIHNNGLFGIVIFDNTSATISNNIISENGSQGINIQNNSDAILIGNTINNNKFFGLNIIGGSYVELSTNTITGNGGLGVALQESSTARVENNIITENNGIGIAILNDTTAELNANTITNNGLSGIVVRGGSIATITETNIRDHMTHGEVGGQGILVLINAKVEISTSTIIENDFGVEIDESSQAKIIQSTISNNRFSGILVSDSSIAELNSNIIDENTDAGVVVLDHSTAEIIDNIVIRNGVAGIITFGGSEATVSNNEIQTNGGPGTLVAETSAALLISNVIYGNDSGGVLVTLGSTVELTANTVQENQGGGLTIRASEAIVRGGIISQNNAHGVFLVDTSTVTLGLDGGNITLARNGGAGIFVTDDGSLARIDSTNIIFNGNAAGNIVGPFEDVAAP